MILGLFFNAAIFVGAHFLTARALGVRGLRPFQLRPAPDSMGASRARRLVVRMSGPALIYLYAAGLFTLSFAFSETMTARVAPVPGSPSAEAGLRDGDTVVAVDGEPVETFDQIRERIGAKASRREPVQLTIDQNGSRQTITVTPGTDGMIGIQARGELRPVPLGSAIGHGLVSPLAVISLFARTVGRIAMEGPEVRTAGGPIAIYAPGPGHVTRGFPILKWVADMCSVAWPPFVLLALFVAGVYEFRARMR